MASRTDCTLLSQITCIDTDRGATACGTAAYSIPRIDQMETNQDEYVPEIQGYYAPNLTEILNQ